jgi:hypothetical protein
MSERSMSSSPRIRLRRRDGQKIHQLKCPGCGKWGDIDDDQFHGRVSTLHEECGFHETADWSRVGLTLEDEAGVF